MEKFLIALLRSTFLGFYFLLLFKSRMVLAEDAVSEMPVVGISELNFSVKAPPGWKVRQNYRGKTLVFEDPFTSAVGQTSYSRNITIAVQSGARPIDGLEVRRLTKRLADDYGRGSSDFHIVEARIIDYRTKADAILVFSSFQLNQVPMRQMHIFTSGADYTALLSFTDLQEAFEADGALNSAWTSMMSAELSGVAPHRYEGLLYSGAGLTLMASAAFFSKRMRRHQQLRQLQAEENALFEDEKNELEEAVEETVKRAVAYGHRSGEDWAIAETRYAGQIA
jgi:hypothetical protein